MHHRSPAAGGNPLRRDADRTRTRLRAAFALACLLAVICGVAVGRTAWTDAGRDAAEIARHRHSVAAVTVGETTHRAGDGPSTRPVTVARATWRDHENRVHTETVPVPVVTRSGDTVRLWVDDAGQAASAPPGTPDIALNAIGLGTGAAGAVALAAGVASTHASASSTHAAHERGNASGRASSPDGPAACAPGREPAMTETTAGQDLVPEVAPDPLEPLPLLRRELHTGPLGLSSREAERRLAVYGANEVRRTTRTSILRELLRQLVHPLALLLWAAAALAFIADIDVLGWAIVAVVLVNAAFALVQEQQAEKAVETLARYLPAQAHVIRDGRPQQVPACDLVPGDLLVLDEGDRVPADARLTEGGIEADLSTLTGESTPVERLAGPGLQGVSLLQEPNLVFSGTTATEGQARAIVFATGDHTELGRIAALSQRTRREPSPLETQVKKVAWLIAAVAVAWGSCSWWRVSPWGCHSPTP